MQEASTSYNPYEYTPSQLWCLGLSAINAEFNGECHDMLKHADKERYANVLRSWWDIHNRRSYEQSVAWLRKEGHRVMFAEHLGAAYVTSEVEWQSKQEAMQNVDPKSANRLTLVRHYRDMIGSLGIIAWDLARVVLLARMAATCGYIDESEAWQTILGEGQQAAGLFSNWYQFSHSYLIGRQYAMGNLDDRDGLENLRIAHKLLTDPLSPWVRYPTFTDDSHAFVAPALTH